MDTIIKIVNDFNLKKKTNDIFAAVQIYSSFTRQKDNHSPFAVFCRSK